MIVGLAAIPAGVLLGGLWGLYGVTVALLVSSIIAAGRDRLLSVGAMIPVLL